MATPAQAVRHERVEADLTVYCDGALALPLAEAYLRCFERETGRADGPRNGIVAGSPDRPRRVHA